MNFTAKDANRLYHSASEANLNITRATILEDIRRVATYGSNFYVINAPRTQLQTEDVTFFENLGYRVITNRTAGSSGGSNLPEFTMLTWDRA